MDFRLMNAAGTCKRLEDVDKLCRSAVTEITVGSITVEPRAGNSGNVLWDDGQHSSLNSLGLPNGGIPYYEKNLLEMVTRVHEAKKELRLSIAPFSSKEIPALLFCANTGAVDAIEVNLSCPNVWESKTQKQIVGFDPELSAGYLEMVLAGFRIGKMVWAKVPPYSDPSQLTSMAERIKKLSEDHQGRLGVVASNTFPNGFAFNSDNKTAITPSDGLAGVAGHAMKYVALGQVRQFLALLPKDVPILGAGGVRIGEDLQDMLQAGAVGVQVNTAYTTGGENPRIFSDILREYVEATSSSP